MATFSEKLAKATNEDKQVNELYKHELRKQFNKLKDDEYDCQLLTIDIDNPIYFNTDGIFSCSYFESLNYYLPFYMLMECKLDKDFNVPEQKAEVLTQVVAYLAQLYYANFVNNESQRKLARDKFKLNTDILDKLEKMPSTVFVGSKATCFAVSTEQLKVYYTNNLDFDSIKSASTFRGTLQGGMVYNNLLSDSMLDSTSPVFNTSNKYCIADIADIIYRYNKNIKDADDLSPKNLYRAFTRFTTRVLTPETVEKLTNRQQASLLAQFIVNRKAIKIENDLDGSIQGLVVNGLHIEVNDKEWNTFSWIYNLKQYNVDEQKKVTAITDQLISEDDRRRKGDFYTPSIWVDEAHKLLDKNLGEGWRDEYMVWDCAWGTGNLTRDCTKLNGTYIKDLYCSTLHETDLEIGARYNANAVKFQYDFLNDDVEEMENIKAALRSPLLFKQGINQKLLDKYLNFKEILDLYTMAVDKGIMTVEEGRVAYNRAIQILKSTKLYECAPTLIDGLLGREGEEPKKLLFLINPPYGTANSRNEINSNYGSKNGMALTKINEIMNLEKVGKCSQQLYAQFMYRIHLIKDLFKSDISIGMFSPSLYISSETYKGIRNIYDNCEVIDSFMLQANQFADVSGTWGIMFSLIKSIDKGNMNTTNTRVMEYDGVRVQEKEKHKIYAVESSCSNWVKEPIKKYKTNKNVVCLTSSIGVYSGDKSRGTLIDGAMGYYVNIGNKVEDNKQDVYILSAPASRGNGFSILDKNFDRVVSNFTARALISGEYASWINGHDEYMIPNTEHQLYEQWQNDCVVYSLFNSKSNQSSLRNIEYNGKTWDIQNEFFWMSVKEIADLAQGKLDKADFNEEVCDDIEQFGDNRFVFKKLQTITLSLDAQLVLDMAKEIVRKSFKYRKDFNQKHPEYHINTWDAGWYQIKGLCKEYKDLKTDLEEFNKVYKQFEDRMRPLVYELGFLYK